jgi:hypothetical protein
MESQTSPKIFHQIALIMAEIGAIGKNRKNIQQNYNFRGIEDVYNTMSPILAKHQVFCVPQVIDLKREERQTAKGGFLMYTILTIRYTFYAMDGSSIEVVTVGEAMDSGDKSCNKAMSTAQKYAFFQVFAIPTEELKDSDDDSPDPLPKHSAEPQTGLGQKTIPPRADSTPKHGAQANPAPDKDKDRAQVHIKQLETFTSLEAFEQYVKRNGQEFRTSPFAMQISAICQAKRAQFAQSMTQSADPHPNQTAEQCH